jgi:hypothetical protein
MERFLVFLVALAAAGLPSSVLASPDANCNVKIWAIDSKLQALGAALNLATARFSEDSTDDGLGPRCDTEDSGRAATFEGPCADSMKTVVGKLVEDAGTALAWSILGAFGRGDTRGRCCRSLRSGSFTAPCFVIR